MRLARKFLPVVSLLAFASAAPAQLRFTEVMSSSANNSQDWIEITNFGAVSVTLDADWKIDDSSNSFGNSLFLNSGTTLVVAPGESVIYIEGAVASIAAFKTLWGLTTVQVGNYSGSGIGLSSDGDGMNLFHTGTNYSGVSFGAATSGLSFFWTYSTAPGTPVSGGPSLSVSGQNGAYQAGADTGSPGFALPLTTPTTLQWIGGPGTWAATGGANWQAGAWDGTKTAVFAAGSGTVTLDDDIDALGLDFRTGGYEISGHGSINTSQVSVVNAGDTAVLDVEITGTGGLTKFGQGTLVLNKENTHTGPTSVAQGVVRVGVDNAIHDESAVNVARFTTFDLDGHSDTVAGIGGLGTIDMGDGDLTVNIAGSENVELNGFLHGTGDFIVDSTGSGDQIFNTTGQSLADGAVKDYTGATIIRNGVLRVNETAVPIATSQVRIEGGKLRLTSDGATYTFGDNAAVEVTLAGGALRQDDGESVTINNNINVVADSTVEARLDAEDPFSAPVVTLAGALSGTATLSVEDGGTVEIATGGSYSGTVSVEASKLRVNGNLSAGTVILDAESRLSGSGSVASIGGSGKVSPGNSPGILTTGNVVTGGGMGFAFEFTAAAPNFSDPLFSGNDVLRITGASPLDASLTSTNTVEIFLSFTSLTEGDIFLGGFYLDQFENFDALIADADFRFYIQGDGNGADAFLDGFGYYSLSSFDPTLGIAISSVAQEADFGAGTVDGGILQMTVVPEPATLSLAVGGLLILGLGKHRRGGNRG